MFVTHKMAIQIFYRKKHTFPGAEVYSNEKYRVDGACMRVVKAIWTDGCSCE